jgi:hypothetical protein
MKQWISFVFAGVLGGVITLMGTQFLNSSQPNQNLNTTPVS